MPNLLHRFACLSFSFFLFFSFFFRFLPMQKYEQKLFRNQNMKLESYLGLCLTWHTNSFQILIANIKNRVIPCCSRAWAPMLKILNNVILKVKSIMQYNTFIHFQNHLLSCIFCCTNNNYSPSSHNYWGRLLHALLDLRLNTSTMR